MKPDQHKKKRSAQYKKKHAISQRKEESKNTTPGKPKLSNANSHHDHAHSISSSTSSASANNPSTSTSFQHTHHKKDFTAADESERVRQFSRRKIESNWDRYEAFDESQDDGTRSSDGLRGGDYKNLLTQTGDATSQFRFKDEQIWEEEESGVGEDQDSDGFPAIDCHALSNQLRAIPLQIRLNIQESFFESSMLQGLNEIALRHKKELESAKTVSPSARNDTSSMVFTTGKLTINSSTHEDTMVGDLSLKDVEHRKATADCNDQVKESNTRKSEDLSSQSKSAEHLDFSKHSRTENNSQICEEQPVPINKIVTSKPESVDVSNAIYLPSHAHSSKISAVIRTADQVKLNSSNSLKDKKQTQDRQKQDPVPLESQTDEIGDEDELDFLLTLENPVQTRSKPDTSSDEVEDGQEEELPSLCQDAAVKSPSVQNPVKPGHQNGQKADSLEDWLDSILDD